MKRINKWTYLLAAALVFSACGNEESLVPAPENEGERNVTVALSIDARDAEGAMTRAGGDGKVPAGYKLRCIVKAYLQGATAPIAESTGDIAGETEFAAISFEPTFRLQEGATYDIVGWASYVKAETENDIAAIQEAQFYDTTQFPLISFKADAASACNDTEDAYTGVMEYEVGSTADNQLTLKRPLTKITLVDIKNGANAFTKESHTYRVVCTLKTAADAGGETPASMKDAAVTFNARTGKVEGNSATSAAFTAPGNGESFSPYLYMFKSESEEDLEIVLTDADNSSNGATVTRYGIKAGTSQGGSAEVSQAATETGAAIEVSQVGCNRQVTVKAKDKEEGGSSTPQSLPLYAIPEIN